METNQSTYLTAVNIKVSKSSNQITDISTQKIPKITNNISITPENDTNFSLPQKMETRNQIVEFLKYSSQRSNLLKTEFMNFLLKDENFSGMNESEKFLREKAINNINIINKNNLEITKKKEEYEKIISELNREINNNIQTKSEQQEKLYIHKKEELQNKIKDKNHELSVFQNTYKEEYKERYLIIQKQKNEVQNIRINQKQFEKYNILNKKIIFEVNQKENLLSDVKKYIDQSRKIFTEEINTKTKTYKDLELEVQILKQSTESIEKSINLIIDKQKKVSKLIEEQIENNNYIKNSLDNVSNEYFNNHMILLKNTEMCNMNLDDLIMNYNEKKNKMNKLRKELYNANQQITYLNENLNKLNKEYNEKKEENKKIIKQTKKSNKSKDKDLLKKEKEKKLMKNKIYNLKNNNKDIFFKADKKTNYLIFCFKYLFESAKILFHSFENSRINFYFDLEQKNKNYNDIINSDYYELIKSNQNYIYKKFTTNSKILESPKNFLIFGFKIFLFYVSAINFMISNVLNLSCFTNQDFIDKFPLSQFNSGIFSFKENDNKNITDTSNDIVFKKESNKVIIQNFLSKDNIDTYKNNLNRNSLILSKKDEIMNKKTEDIIKQNKTNNKTDIDNNIKKKNPIQIFTNFMHDEGVQDKIKNSRYIRNHPTSSLLSLRRFFGEEEQNNLFAVKSVNLKNNNTRNKLNGKTFDINSDYSQFSINKKNKNYIKNKKLNDPYLSKEYMYEFETDEPKTIKNKKSARYRPKHKLKYAGQDPQKQLIFERMLDIRNLELKSSSINTKSTNINEITDEKKSENKFYEMYDKFKKKYFFNSKKAKDGLIINHSYKDIRNEKNMDESREKNRKNNIYNLNLKQGFKFIRNNSDFFYGIKGNNSLKNKHKKFELPNIIKNDKKKRNDNSKNDYS